MVTLLIIGQAGCPDSPVSMTLTLERTTQRNTARDDERIPISQLSGRYH